MACFIMRYVAQEDAGSSTGFRVIFTRDQKESARRLAEGLALQDPEDSLAEEWRSLFEAFFFSTCHAVARHAEQDPMACFLMASNIRKDGGFALAKDITPKLAGIKYIMRLVMLARIMRLAARDDEEDDEEDLDDHDTSDQPPSLV